MIEWIVSSSILITVIITLRYLFKGRISLHIQYALWVLVLVRLLVPFSFGNTGFSVLNILPENPDEALLSAVLSVGVPNDADTLPSEGTAVPKNNAAAEIQSKMQQDTIANVESNTMDWGTIAFILWIAGVSVVGLFLLLSNLRFAARVKKTRHAIHAAQSSLPVYITNAMDTPCLFGLFHPAIYLTPDAAKNATVLRHTIVHETTHFRHGDNLWAGLRCICLALHWYNPLVWWAAYLSMRDAELACDEATIHKIGEHERAEYGRTLIRMTCRKRTTLLVTATTMTGSRRSITERIMLIAKKPKMAVYTLIAVVLIATVAVGCSFTGAMKNGDTESEAVIRIDDGVDAPDAVLDFAKEYVRKNMEYYIELGLYPDDESKTYKIIDAKITGLTQINTGTATNNTSINLYLLEYRLLPDHPENVVVAGGMMIDDGWITEWGSTGQPYLLLYCDESGPEQVWERICVTNTDIIMQDYGTPEMLEKYGNPYTAAAMELYHAYSGKN